MAKILITTIPYWGHINVTLSVGQLLLEKGHEVCWALARDIKGLTLPQGGKLYFTNSENNGDVNTLLEKLDFGKSMSGLQGSKYVLEEVLLPLGRLMYEGLNNCINDFKPDVIINDEQTYIGGICATKLNIPYVTTHAAPSGIYESSDDTIKYWYSETILNYQKEFDLYHIPNITRSHALGLVFCPRNFENPNDTLEGQQFVGPCIDTLRPFKEEFDYTAIQNERATVLVSIGTLLTEEAHRFYSKVINDFRGENYNVIVAGDPLLFEEWPSNFIVQKRVPHQQLLRHLDIIISHGGANTVCDAIANKIPLVVVPMAFDQYFLADKVQYHEMGQRLKYKRLKKGQLLNACNSILTQANYKINIDKYAMKLKAGGGAKAASELVEKFIKTNKK